MDRLPRRQRRILVYGQCSKNCNRFTVLKDTGIWDPKRGFFIKLPVCTGCMKREDDCFCKYVEYGPIIGNPDTWEMLKKKMAGPFQIVENGQGNGSIHGKPW